MRFCSIASGSNGNCTLIETSEHRILVDIGLSARNTEKLLSAKGIDPRTITAVCVTHEHTDHTSGVGVWARRYKVPILATPGTWQGMAKTIGEVPGEMCFELQRGKNYKMSGLTLSVIPTSHDANSPCGYAVESEGCKAAVVTDTGIVTEEIIRHLAESDICVFESNHDVQMLKNGPYPASLKARIRSRYGHLSNTTCGETIALLREYNKKGIFLLGHLSDENNTPSLALATVKTLVEEAGYSSENIYVTHRDRSSDMYIVQ